MKRHRFESLCLAQVKKLVLRSRRLVLQGTRTFACKQLRNYEFYDVTFQLACTSGNTKERKDPWRAFERKYLTMKVSLALGRWVFRLRHTRTTAV